MNILRKRRCNRFSEIVVPLILNIKLMSYLQDFNMVKIESRLRTLSIRQAFLNGGESHSGRLMLGSWVRVPQGSQNFAALV